MKFSYEELKTLRALCLAYNHIDIVHRIESMIGELENGTN